MFRLWTSFDIKRAIGDKAEATHCEQCGLRGQLTHLVIEYPETIQGVQVLFQQCSAG